MRRPWRATPILGLVLPNEVVRGVSAPVATPALLLIAFSWFYPHFLDDRSALIYRYAAPLGLVPCPTLSALIGFALLARGFESRAWSTVLASLGLAYAIFGSLRLGGAIDAVLAVGALSLWEPSGRGATRHCLAGRAALARDRNGCRDGCGFEPFSSRLAPTPMRVKSQPETTPPWP